MIQSLISLHQEIKKNTAKALVLHDFIVFNIFFNISVHFRYIYSTNLIHGQGAVRCLNLSQKYAYIQRVALVGQTDCRGRGKDTLS